MNDKSRFLRTLAAVVSLIVVGVAPCAGQGFAGLGEDAGGFAQVVPGKEIVFPRDHGAHPDYRIEWWYVTANMQDAQGKSYGVQWTLFRQATLPNDHGEGWGSRQVWMGHAAFTASTVHRFAERFARGGVGQAGVEVAPFRAWIDDWEVGSSPSSGSNLTPMRLKAAAADFSYDLRLDGNHSPVLQGQAGYSRKSERDQASYYYSHPYLSVSGAIVIDGKSIDVIGQAWLDHEWSSQPLASDQTGWDWFSLHLDSGEKLMLFRLRHADGKHFFAGNWIEKDGQSVELDPSAISMTPVAHLRVAQRDVPTAWAISIPSRHLEIQTAPLNPQSWMDTRFKYWEGPIKISGNRSGTGFLEMTGY